MLYYNYNYPLRDFPISISFNSISKNFTFILKIHYHNDVHVHRMFVQGYILLLHPTFFLSRFFGFVF